MSVRPTVEQLEEAHDALLAIQTELGIPSSEYPAPVANAWKIAGEAAGAIRRAALRGAEAPSDDLIEDEQWHEHTQHRITEMAAERHSALREGEAALDVSPVSVDEADAAGYPKKAGRSPSPSAGLVSAAREALLDILDVTTGWTRRMDADERLDAIDKIARSALAAVEAER